MLPWHSLFSFVFRNSLSFREIRSSAPKNTPNCSIWFNSGCFYPRPKGLAWHQPKGLDGIAARCAWHHAFACISSVLIPCRRATDSMPQQVADSIPPAVDSIHGAAVIVLKLGVAGHNDTKYLITHNLPNRAILSLACSLLGRARSGGGWVAPPCGKRAVCGINCVKKAAWA